VLTREVERHDPNWRPEPAIHEGVEGQIQANQAVARQAKERLRELGVSEPRAMSQEEALRQGGREIGKREGRASSRVRTCTPEDFQGLLDAVSPGAREVPTRVNYHGVWFEQPNGSVFGLRMSKNYGMTYDVIRSNDPLLRSYKVHQK
jgi:filamentous hemagglutinin